MRLPRRYAPRNDIMVRSKASAMTIVSSQKQPLAMTLKGGQKRPLCAPYHPI